MQLLKDKENIIFHEYKSIIMSSTISVSEPTYKIAVNSFTRNFVYEYSNNLCKLLNATIVVYDGEYTIPEGDNSYYIFMELIPLGLTSAASEIKSRLSLLNIDQFPKVRLRYFDVVKAASDAGIRILTYAISNEHKNLLDMTYVPCLIDETETAQLSELIKTANRYCDVSFCGYMEPRRRKIIVDLEKRGLIVNNVVGWGKHRDAQIAGSKIFLNIHTFECATIYENIRCDRWAAAGMIVVTEDCAPESFDGSDQMLLSSSYDKLVDFIVEVLANYETHQTKLNNYLNTNLNMIIKDRQQRCLESVNIQKIEK